MLLWLALTLAFAGKCVNRRLDWSFVKPLQMFIHFTHFAYLGTLWVALTKIAIVKSGFLFRKNRISLTLLTVGRILGVRQRSQAFRILKKILNGCVFLLWLIDAVMVCSMVFWMKLCTTVLLSYLLLSKNFAFRKQVNYQRCFLEICGRRLIGYWLDLVNKFVFQLTQNAQTAWTETYARPQLQKWG